MEFTSKTHTTKTVQISTWEIDQLTELIRNQFDNEVEPEPCEKLIIVASSLDTDFATELREDFEVSFPNYDLDADNGCGFM